MSVDDLMQGKGNFSDKQSEVELSLKDHTDTSQHQTLGLKSQKRDT